MGQKGFLHPSEQGWSHGTSFHTPQPQCKQQLSERFKSRQDGPAAQASGPQADGEIFKYMYNHSDRDSHSRNLKLCPAIFRHVQPFPAIPAYSNLFRHFPDNSSFFPAFSSLLQHNPACYSLLQSITAYYSLFKSIQANFIL